MNREIGIFVLGAVLGGVVGALVMRTPSVPLPGASDTKGTYEEGYGAAKKELEELRVIAPEPASMNEVVGAIIDLGDGTFVMQVDPETVNPLVKDVPQQREVVVTSATVIVGMERKDEDAYAREMKAYEEAFAATVDKEGATTPAAPSQFVEKKLTFKDLVQGNRVTVDAGRDVKSDAKFTAIRITVGYRPAAPTMLPPPPPPGGGSVTAPPPSTQPPR